METEIRSKDRYCFVKDMKVPLSYKKYVFEHFTKVLQTHLRQRTEREQEWEVVVIRNTTRITQKTIYTNITRPNPPYL